MDVHDPSMRLQPVDSHRHIACDICGQYFGSMQHLMSHYARKHPEAEFPAATGAYYEHTVDGMPECRHCGAKFNRVAAMRKHLKGACPVLYAKRKETTCTVLTGEVPLKNAELLTGHTCRAPNDGSSEAPLVQNQEYCALARVEWKQALRRPHLVQSLRTHCAVCRQWISMQGPGAKQHYRLAHPELWNLKAEAVSRCKGLGFAYTRPCSYCNQDFKDPRAHVPRCGAVFQASITSLWLSQDNGGQRGCRDGRSSSPGVCRGDGSTTGAAKPDDSNPTQTGGGQGKGGGSAIQVPPTGNRGQQGPRPEARQGELGPKQLGQCKLESFFRLGRPGGAGEQATKRARLCDPSSAALDDQTGHTPRRRTGQASSGHVMDAVCDTHDEGTVPLLQQAAEQWQIKCEAREVTTGLRVVLFLALVNEAKRRLELMLEPEQQQRATNVGWMGQGSTALTPVWHYHVWNPERMQQERSERPPLCHQTALQHLQTLLDCSAYPNVLTRFKATRGLEGEHTSPVVPFMLSLSLRNEATARCHQALAALDGNACLKPTARKRPAIPIVPRAGGPLPQALLHGLDGEAQSAGAEEVHPAPHDTRDGRTVNQAARRVTCQLAHPSPQVPQARLQNPHSLCYMNSVAQSLAWRDGCLLRRCFAGKLTMRCRWCCAQELPPCIAASPGCPMCKPGNRLRNSMMPVNTYSIF